MKPLRQLAFGCAVLLSGTSNALAYAPEPCFTPHISIEEVTIQLAKDGWESAARDDLEVIEHLAWMGMPQYFIGDRGGSRIERTLEVKYLAAKGVWNKKELTSSKTRILRREAGQHREVAIIIWNKIGPSTILDCTFSLSSVSIADWASQVPNQGIIPNFMPIAADYFPHEDTRTSVRLTALNRSKLADRVKAPVPSDAILETTIRFFAKVK